MNGWKVITAWKDDVVLHFQASKIKMKMDTLMLNYWNDMDTIHLENVERGLF